MRLRRHLWLVALLAFVLATLPAIASSEPLPVEAINVGGGIYPATHYWSNPQQTVIAGEKVKFSNSSTTVPHGLEFTGGGASAAQICSGLPVGATKPTGEFNWHAECTFTKPGIYTFICTVHPSEMKGTITVAGTPTDATTSASGETQTEAMLSGSVNPEGNTVEYHFEYGSGSVTEHTTSVSTLSAADFTSHSVSAQVTGLQPSMTYHFLLVATYGAGKAVAGATTQTFTTHAVTAPTVTTLAAEGFKETEATLKGTVNLGGEATEYFFEYGTDTNYGQKTAMATLQTSGGSNQGVSAALKGLTAGTEYHFRLVAKNAVGGPISGLDRTFKTESPPVSKEPPSPTTTTTTPPPPPPTTTTATTTTPIVEPPPGPPIVGGPALAASQHGSSVRGSLDISSAGAGGRLEVDLFAKSASLAKTRHSSSVRVGRLVRSSVSAGKVSFSVALTAAGKRALARKHRLSLTVKIVITPARGAPVSITRSVVLRS